MDNWFGTRRWLLFFVAVIVLALVISITVQGRQDITGPEKIIFDITAYFQKLIYKPAHYVAGLYEDVRGIKQLYEENKSLKESLNHMVYIQAELKLVNEENQRIRELLDFKESLRDYDVIAANVVGRSPSRWDNIVTIDRGKKHGVERNMAVINHEGLVGKIYSVSNYSAKVLLLTDSHAPSGISALVLAKEQSFGVIEEYDTEYGYLVMSMIKPDVPLEKEDIVVTSGFGEVFPKGLVIGKIVAAKRTEGGLTQSVFVEPAANTQNLNELLVIKRTLLVDDNYSDEADEETETEGEEMGY